MKRHQAVAASVGEYDDGPRGAVATQAQTATYRKVRYPRRAASEPHLAAASVSLRAHTLILTGALDGSSAWALEAEIERLCEERVTSITLDLRELMYIDPIGVAVIAFRCRLCQRHGFEFALIPGGRRIHLAFERAGVAGLLPFSEDGGAPSPAEDGGAAAAAPAPAPALVLSHAGGELQR